MGNKDPLVHSGLKREKNLHGEYIVPVSSVGTGSPSENNHTLFVLGARHDVEAHVPKRSAGL